MDAAPFMVVNAGRAENVTGAHPGWNKAGLRAFFLSRNNTLNRIIYIKHQKGHSMSNKKRIILPDVTYHCFTRCHGKRNLFHSSHVKKYLIEAINMCHNKYEFELIAAEPVGNHIHLIIRTLEHKETISSIMQYIKARIAEKYNKAREETGAFWNERYGSTIIEHSDNPTNYLLWLLWYIAYNPVRKKLSTDPRKNDIGFINCYLEKNYTCPVKINLHKYFINLAESFEECVNKFLFYEEAYRKRIALI